MRNGVLAITRDARLALINDEAYRIFGVDGAAGRRRTAGGRSSSGTIRTSSGCSPAPSICITSRTASRCG